QEQLERGAHARLALDPQLAAEEASEPARDGQPKAGAGRGTLARGRRDLDEFVEDAVDIRLRNADAGVGDGDPDPALFAGRAARGQRPRGLVPGGDVAHGDGHRPAWRKLYRIREKIEQDLTHPRGVRAKA